MIEQDTIKLLRECDAGTKMGITSIDDVLDFVRSHRLKQRLYELESILPPTFIRINKSTLANEHRIDRFDAAFSGGVDAVFRCGYREYVSRRCFAEIRRRYEGS